MDWEKGSPSPPRTDAVESFAAEAPADAALVGDIAAVDAAVAQPVAAGAEQLVESDVKPELSRADQHARGINVLLADGDAGLAVAGDVGACDDYVGGMPAGVAANIAVVAAVADDADEASKTAIHYK